MSPILADAARLIMPIKASTVSGEVDWLMWFNIWVCIAFGLLIFVGTAWLGWKYRHRPGVNDVGRGPTHSNLLEIVWSVIPLIIVLLIAIWGFQGYMALAVLPPANDADTMEIGVEAYKWGWRFVYPNGYTESTLHVPVNTKIRLVESSADVIHSLYMPEFRIKKDAVPGRFNKQWFEATEPSPMGKDLSKPKVKDPKTRDDYEDLNWADPASFSYDVDANLSEMNAQAKEKQNAGFDIFCTEYCGTRHSRMLSRVYVHPDVASFRAWLSAASDVYRNNDPAYMVGMKLIKANGCFACHSVDGSNGTGPTWKDLFGEPVQFANGSGIPTADENYIRKSILYPQADIVQGYGPAMPSYLGKFSDRDLAAIIAYMKSISSHFKGSPAEFNDPTPKMNEKKSETK